MEKPKVAVDNRTAGRLSKPERRQQLLETARLIVREEGADRLTLGHLAVRAGVSKPVTYEHFETRTGLLIELYRWIDTERITAFRTLMAQDKRPARETVAALAKTYLACGTDQGDEFHAVGAALAGSEEKAGVYQELVDAVIEMFVEVLRPHSSLRPESLALASAALVAAGDALTTAVTRGNCSAAEAEEVFSVLIGAVAPGEVRELMPGANNS
ncbi:TetR/AcrR family transcriptional regulator (plasmid) [Agrobacterium sp. rho-13.3]|uniref:TetR/AcrR family transcriptional regulator n=1 Tax=Agrobacterium sp. rho-13.3 TaxID=3072980 RepID=UPI002A0DFFF0|nr:TetR/AcrR family transcriptional regulator [Agrobacterium sp. rho-13.3]MDX8310331.1 TetR/AcrR family transcriptional regulator [Agrobacterium sp. rho-13.3]